jgi:hypothetical protein
MLFREWRGEDGGRGFTLDPQMFPHEGPMGFYFGTQKIGDPQFRGTGRAASSSIVSPITSRNDSSSVCVIALRAPLASIES